MRKYRVKPSIKNKTKEVAFTIAPLLLLFIPGLNMISIFAFVGTWLAIPVYTIIYIFTHDIKIKNLLKRSIALCIVTYFAYGTYIAYNNAITPHTKPEEQYGSIYSKHYVEKYN